jgi:proline dehydrogenase
MFRHIFLFLSRQRALRRWMETSPLSGRFTRRFIAGLTLDEELEVCRRLNAEGIMTTVDRLGENVTSRDEAERSRDAYLRVLDRIAAERLNSTVSVKLTQLGLDFGEDVCFPLVRALACRAKQLGTGIEIDMESSAYVDRTLDVAIRLHQETSGVRAVVQAYLRRTDADVKRLNELGVPVRLVKGAYDEPPSVAFPTKREVNSNFVRLMKLLMDQGVCPAIATHDEHIIGEALRHVHERRMPKDRFEFQMLYGIRRDLQRNLVSEGYRLRVYVPYGEAWYPYFMRRLAERPANVLFVVRNLFRA